MFLNKETCFFTSKSNYSCFNRTKLSCYKL